MLLPSALQIGVLPATRTRRGVVAEDSGCQIPIESAGQIPRLRVRRQIDRPQIRLRVGIDRLIDRRDEGELISRPGLNARSFASISIVVIFIGSPPPAAME